MEQVSWDEFTDQHLVNYFSLKYFILITSCRNYLLWLQGADNADQSLLRLYTSATLMEIYSRGKDLDPTEIYGQSEARWIDCLTWGKLHVTMLLYWYYDVFNVLPFFTSKS